MHTRFTTTCILISAAALALPSCRIINGKPDFHWIGDQFTPPVDDSVFVDRGVGALDIPASETISPTEATAPIPAPLPSATQETAPAAMATQKQPRPATPAPQPPQQPTVYTVVAGDTLSGIAARHKTGTKTLIELNKLDINKPLQLNQKLLIPVDGASVGSTLPAPQATARPDRDEQPGFFSNLFGQQAADNQPQTNTTYTVVAGDTLSAIARSHRTTTRRLIELNRLDINKPLQINQQLLIPSGASQSTSPRRTPTPKKQETTATEPVSVILPSQETASASEPQPEQTSPQPPQTAPEQSAEGAASVYTIRPGDTLYGIARKLNISPEFLMNANGLTPATADKLRAGATLNLPTQKQP